MTVRHEMPWRRKHWLGRVEGPDRDFGAKLEFMHGTPVKSRGVLKYDLEPGWYAEVRAGVREYIEVDQLTVGYIPSHLDDLIPLAAQGPPPGEPGSWNDTRCACGEEVEYYSPTMFPYCEPCYDAANIGEAPIPTVKRELTGNIV